MFTKLFSGLQLFVSVDIKLISVVVLLLMSTSVNCQSNDSICNFLIKEGRVRELGLYQFIDKNNGISYRLFSREWDGIRDEIGPIAEEHQLEIKNGDVKAEPSTFYEHYALHKWYGGYGKGNDDGEIVPIERIASHFNCWLPKQVCL